VYRCPGATCTGYPASFRDPAKPASQPASPATGQPVSARPALFLHPCSLRSHGCVRHTRRYLMDHVENLSRDYIPVRMHHPFRVTGLDLDLVSTHTRCWGMPCNVKNLRHTLEVFCVGGLEGLVESLRPDVTC
jgi:hypothetical protein